MIPFMKTRVWECLFFFKLLVEMGLSVERITLWASTCLSSSLAKVTSIDYIYSHTVEIIIIPLVKIRGWECLFCFNLLFEKVLDAERIILWASTCLLSSLAKVTSINYLYSHINYSHHLNMSIENK